MKKSQILAALALAFALGVVAPVAGTYAKMSASTTIDQSNDVNAKVVASQTEASTIENLNDYKVVYSAIETINNTKGYRAKLDDVVADAKDVFNATYAASTSTLNTKIESAINNAITAFQRANLNNTNLDQSTPLALSKFGTSTDLEVTYKALKNVEAAVKHNQGLLTSNYDASKQPVIDLQADYTAILAQITSAINAIDNELYNAPVYTSGFENAFKAINADAWNALTSSQAWVDAAANSKTVDAVRMGMIIKAAEALPKYNFVLPVLTAETNFNRITSNTETVDYGQALGYINAYDAALTNFKNGTTDPGTQQPTDPDTKPGDDNKGDDGNKTPTTPGTGIVSTAEGSASTTISIVAGLATALTALGAGVVAYRNARRSSEK